MNSNDDKQIELEEYLWDSGYYMPLPIESEEQKKDADNV